MLIFLMFYKHKHRSPGFTDAHHTIRRCFMKFLFRVGALDRRGRDYLMRFHAMPFFVGTAAITFARIVIHSLVLAASKEPIIAQNKERNKWQSFCIFKASIRSQFNNKSCLHFLCFTAKQHQKGAIEEKQISYNRTSRVREESHCRADWILWLNY